MSAKYKAFFKLMISSTVLFASAAEANFHNFDEAEYNRLSSLGATHKRLEEASSMTKFLEEAKTIVLKYDDGADFLGVRILHTHNTLAPGEAMVEGFEGGSNGPALVTENKLLAEQKGAKPASWITRNQTIKVFEYATDPVVVGGLDYLEEHSALFNSLSDSLYKHDLQQDLALSIVGRRAFDYFDAAQALVETSTSYPSASGTRFQNIIKGYHPAKWPQESLLMTTFPFLGEAKKTGCLLIPVPCSMYQGCVDYYYHFKD